MTASDLSLAQARRIALAAQGFDRPRPARVDARHLRATLRRLGLLQLDYVNTLLPAHYVVPFSRLGPYERARLDEVVYRKHEFTEQWAHQRSVVPMETWPLLSHRREDPNFARNRYARALRQHRAYAERMLEQVREKGPLGADDLPDPEGVPRRIQSSWTGTLPGQVLEAWFSRGKLCIADRRPGFGRVYDLAERIVPAEHRRRRVDPHAAQRELLLQAARAHGVATAADLANYWIFPMAAARPRIAELVDGGQLREVRVEGWRAPAYLHPDAKLPRKIDAAALLAPFDPVIWHRPRAARLFEFEYTVEIFVPESKRRYGHYVLPFLLADRLVARVDLKSDRAAGRLRALGAWIEPGVAARSVAPALAAELRTLCEWLGFDRIDVGRRGGLARALSAELR